MGLGKAKTFFGLAYKGMMFGSSKAADACGRAIEVRGAHILWRGLLTFALLAGGKEAAQAQTCTTYSPLTSFQCTVN